MASSVSRSQAADRAAVALNTADAWRQAHPPRIIDRLKPQVSGIIINANGDTSRFAAFGLSVVPDSAVGYAGPLLAMAAVLLSESEP